MTERSYEDAVQVLKQRFGGHWEVTEGDGRDDIIDALENELGYDHATASDTVDALISSGQLRYHRYGDDATLANEVPPVPPVTSGIGSASTVGAGSIGTPIVPAAALGPGYWQIGRDQGESGSPPGRAGQVDPTE